MANYSPAVLLLARTSLARLWEVRIKLRGLLSLLVVRSNVWASGKPEELILRLTQKNQR